jgi:hypothetical protein
MLHWFGCKIFFRKYFMYFFILCAIEKWWSTKIIISLTVKAYLILEKRFTILKPVNRFLHLNSSFLQAHLWESATAEHWSLLVAWIYCRKSTNFGIRSPESGRCWNLALVCRNPTTSITIAAFQLLDSCETGRNSVSLF